MFFVAYECKRFLYILYPEIFPSSLIISNIFLVASWGVFYVQYHVIYKQRQFYLFSIWIPFISFSSQIAVARTSKTMFNNSGESRHLYIVLDCRGNVSSFSPLRMMFAVDLSYMTFITVRQFPSVPTFWRAIIIILVINGY